jgi:hypothetical protein
MVERKKARALAANFGAWEARGEPAEAPIRTGRIAVGEGGAPRRPDSTIIAAPNICISALEIGFSPFLGAVVTLQSTLNQVQRYTK